MKKHIHIHVSDTYTGPEYAIIKAVDEFTSLVTSNTGRRLGTYPHVKAKQVAENAERMWMEEYLAKKKTKDASQVEKVTYYSEYEAEQDVKKRKKAGWSVGARFKNPEGTIEITYHRTTKDASNKFTAVVWEKEENWQFDVTVVAVSKEQALSMIRKDYPERKYRVKSIHQSSWNEDAQFVGTYSAKLRDGKEVTITASVKGVDKYDAGDELKALAEARYGKDLYYPKIIWGNAPKLSQKSESARAVRGAGLEEDGMSVKDMSDPVLWAQRNGFKINRHPESGSTKWVVQLIDRNGHQVGIDVLTKDRPTAMNVGWLYFKPDIEEWLSHNKIKLSRDRK